MPQFHTLKKNRKKLYNVNTSLDSAYKSLRTHIAQNNYEVVVDYDNPDKLVELRVSRCGSIEVQANITHEIPSGENTENSLIAGKVFIPRNPVVETSFRVKKLKSESISSIKSSARNSITTASHIKRIEQEIDSIALLNALNQEIDPLNPKIIIKPKKDLSFRSTNLKSGNLVSIFGSSPTQSDKIYIDGHTCPSHETQPSTRPTTTSTLRSKTPKSKKESSNKGLSSNDDSIKIKILSRASNKPEEIYITYSETPDKISADNLNRYLQAFPTKDHRKSLSVRVRKHSLIELPDSESLAGNNKSLFKASRLEHVGKSSTDTRDYTIKGSNYSPSVDMNLTTLQTPIDYLVGESFERPIDTSGHDLQISDVSYYKNISNQPIELLESHNKFEGSSKLSDQKLETQSSQHDLETRYYRNKPIVGSSNGSIGSNKLEETLKSLDKVSIVYRPRYKRLSLSNRYSQVSAISNQKQSESPLIVVSNKTLYSDAFANSHNSRPKPGRLQGKLLTGRPKSTGEVIRGRMIRNVRIDRSRS